MENLMENWQVILSAAASIVGGFAVLATFTPNRSDDKYVQYVLDFINVLGGNFGKSKNK